MIKLNNEQSEFLAKQYDRLVRDHAEALEEIEAQKKLMEKIQHKLFELAELVGIDFDTL